MDWIDGAGIGGSGLHSGDGSELVSSDSVC